MLRRSDLLLVLLAATLLFTSCASRSRSDVSALQSADGNDLKTLQPYFTGTATFKRNQAGEGTVDFDLIMVEGSVPSGYELQELSLWAAFDIDAQNTPRPSPRALPKGHPDKLYQPHDGGHYHYSRSWPADKANFPGKNKYWIFLEVRLLRWGIIPKRHYHLYEWQVPPVEPSGEWGVKADLIEF